MKTLKFVAVLSFILLSASLFAQNKQVDSLLKLYDRSKEDTSRVNLLLSLSKAHLSIDPDAAIRYAKQAGEYAHTLRYDKGKALSRKNIGLGLVVKGQYIEALQQYEQALALYKSIGDKSGQTSLLKNIGSVFGLQGDDDKALEYYLQALTLSEETKDTLQQLSSLSNIGTIYMYRAATHDKAFLFLRQAYALSKGFNDANALGSVAVNLGELYLTHEQYDSAMYYFNVSKAAFEGTADVAYTMNNIGKLYLQQKQFDQAIAIQKKAIDIAKQYDSQDNVLVSLVGIAQSYEQQENMPLALSYYEQAEKLANTLVARYALVEVYEGLAWVHSNLSDYQNAFRYQRMLTTIKDTVFNLESDKKLGTLQFTYDLDKKSAEINLLSKDRELQTKELARQKMVRNGFIGGFAALSLVAGVILLQRNRISKEKKRSEALLLNILPEETAAELKQFGKAKARAYDNVTVLFTDFKGFSKMAETMSAEALVGEIDYYFRAFDRIIKPFGIEKIKTIGDAYMAACGVPVANPYHALNVIQAAFRMRDFCADEAEKRRAANRPFFEIRIGVNSGSLVAGIVGESKFAYDIWGDTVNMAARMEQSGVPGKVNVTEDTYVLIRDKFECVHRGKLSVKHKDDVEMYFVECEITESAPLSLHGSQFAPESEHPLLRNAIQTQPQPAAKQSTKSTRG